MKHQQTPTGIVLPLLPKEISRGQWPGAAALSHTHDPPPSLPEINPARDEEDSARKGCNPVNLIRAAAGSVFGLLVEGLCVYREKRGPETERQRQWRRSPCTLR